MAVTQGQSQAKAGRWHLLVGVPTLAMALAACGSSSGHTASASTASISPAATATTAAATTEAAPPPATPPTPTNPGLTWVTTFTRPGGYHYEADITAGAIRRANNGDVGDCPFNPATDAAIPLDIKIKNDTSFPTQVGITIENGPLDIKNSCVGDTDNGGNPDYSLYSTNNLNDGQFTDEPAYLLIRNYYSPDHPNGDPTKLNEDSFFLETWDPSGPITSDQQDIANVTGPLTSQKTYDFTDLASSQ